MYIVWIWITDTVTRNVFRFYVFSKRVNSITTCRNINYSKITVSEVCTCANTCSGTRESDLPHQGKQDERGSFPGRCRNFVDSPPRPYGLERWLVITALPGTVGKGVKQSLRFQFASSGMRGASATHLRGEALIQRSSFSLYLKSRSKAGAFYPRKVQGLTMTGS